MDDACEALQNGLSEFAGVGDSARIRESNCLLTSPFLQLRARIAVILGQPIPEGSSAATPVRHATGASAKASRKGVAWEVKRVSHFAPHRSGHPTAAQAAIKAMLERMAEQRAAAPAADAPDGTDTDLPSGLSSVQDALLQAAPGVQEGGAAGLAADRVDAADAGNGVADEIRTPPSRSRSPSPERPAVFARGSGIALSPVAVMTREGYSSAGLGTAGTPSGSGAIHSARGTPGRAERPAERDSHTTPVRSSSARPAAGGLGTPPRPGSTHHTMQAHSPGEQAATHAPLSAHKVAATADESGTNSNANATRASTAVLLMHEFDRMHTAKWGDIMMDETEDTWLASAAASPERPTPLQRSLDSARSAEPGSSSFPSGSGTGHSHGQGNAWGRGGGGGRKAPMRTFEDLQHSPGSSSPSAPSSGLKNKLSSPVRHRSTPDAVAAKAEERQAKAEANRGRIQEEKRHKLQEASQRQAEVSAWQHAVRVEKSVSLASKLSAAEERHEGMLRAKAAKAGHEVAKAQEVRHMGIREVENKRRAIEVSQEQAAKRRAETLAKRAGGAPTLPAHLAGVGTSMGGAAPEAGASTLSAEALLAKQRAAGFSYASAAAGMSRDSASSQHTPAAADYDVDPTASSPALTAQVQSMGAAADGADLASLQPAAVPPAPSAAAPSPAPTQPPAVIVVKPFKVAPWAALSSASSSSSSAGTASRSSAHVTHIRHTGASALEEGSQAAGSTQSSLSILPEPASVMAVHVSGGHHARRASGGHTVDTSVARKEELPKQVQAADEDGFATVGSRKAKEKGKERLGERKERGAAQAGSDKGKHASGGKAKEAEKPAAPVVTTRASIPSAPSQPAWRAGSKPSALSSHTLQLSNQAPLAAAAPVPVAGVKQQEAVVARPAAASLALSAAGSRRAQHSGSTAAPAVGTGAGLTKTDGPRAVDVQGKGGAEEGWTHIGATTAPVPPPQRKSKSTGGLPRTAAAAGTGGVGAGLAGLLPALPGQAIAAPLIDKVDNALGKPEKQASSAATVPSGRADVGSRMVTAVPVPVAAAPVAPWATGARTTPSRPPSGATQAGHTEAKENSKPTGSQTASPVRADTLSSSPASTVVSVPPSCAPLLDSHQTAVGNVAQGDEAGDAAKGASPTRAVKAEKVKAKQVDEDLDEDALLEKLAQENASNAAAQAVAKAGMQASTAANAKVSAARKKKLKQKKAVAHNAATVYAAALHSAGVDVGVGGKATPPIASVLVASLQPVHKACSALVKASPVEDLPPALHASAAVVGDKDEPLEEGEIVDAGVPTVRTHALAPTVTLQVQGAALQEVDKHVREVWKALEGPYVQTYSQDHVAASRQAGKRVSASKIQPPPMYAVPDPRFNTWLGMQHFRVLDTAGKSTSHVPVEALELFRTSGALSSTCRCLSREMLTFSPSTVSYAVRLIALACYTAEGRQHLLTRGAGPSLVDILTLCSADMLSLFSAGGGGRKASMWVERLSTFPQHTGTADAPEQHLYAIFVNSCMALSALLSVPPSTSSTAVHAALAVAQAGSIGYALTVGVPQATMGVVRAVRSLKVPEQLNMGPCVSAVALLLCALVSRPLVDGAVYGLADPVEGGVYPAHRLLGVPRQTSCVPGCPYVETLLASLAESKWNDLAPVAQAWLACIEGRAEGLAPTHTENGKAQLTAALNACSAAMQLANAVARLDIRGLRRSMLVDAPAPAEAQELSPYARQWLYLINIFARYVFGVLALEGEDPAAAARYRSMIAAVEPLFGELCLALEYACLSCPLLLSALGQPFVPGRTASLLEFLATLPTKYYSNPVLRGVVLPTLMILAGSGCAENREALLRHLPPSAFAAYLLEQEKGAETPVMPHFKLAARVPRSQWRPLMEAISGSLLSGEVS